MAGKVEEILICKAAGDDLYAVERAELVPGKGIIGDRYYHKVGYFSEKLEEKGDFEVTLIEKEEIQFYNKLSNLDLKPNLFRRNIITSGIRLNELIGKKFYIGETILEGIRLCEPCIYLEKLIGKEIIKSMTHKSGIRAIIKKGGIIEIGNKIEES